VRYMRSQEALFFKPTKFKSSSGHDYISYMCVLKTNFEIIPEQI
jgi:hypothetical protein